MRFVAGLAKKLLIANPIGAVADQLFAIEPADLPTWALWLAVVCYALQIYFDFSGYSDMAIGIARMFGFRFPENFNYPYTRDLDPGFLAALAHHAVGVVPRLRLRAARRQPRLAVADHDQSVDRVPAVRRVARRELEFHRLGHVARPVPVDRAHRRGAAAADVAAGVREDRLRPADRADRLGVLPPGRRSSWRSRCCGGCSSRRPRRGTCCWSRRKLPPQILAADRGRDRVRVSGLACDQGAAGGRAATAGLAGRLRCRRARCWSAA